MLKLPISLIKIESKINVAAPKSKLGGGEGGIAMHARSGRAMHPLLSPFSSFATSPIPVDVPRDQKLLALPGQRALTGVRAQADATERDP